MLCECHARGLSERVRGDVVRVERRAGHGLRRQFPNGDDGGGGTRRLLNEELTYSLLGVLVGRTPQAPPLALK